MMNPQYPPPGQNNNAPSNPLGFPPSQDYNGIHNANIYGQPSNGPTDMSQRMQNMNLNGPQGQSQGQGFQNIPVSQLPPGQNPPNFPPTSNYAGQLPTGAKPFQGRPAVSSNLEHLSNSLAPTPTPRLNYPPGFGHLVPPPPGFQPKPQQPGMPPQMGGPQQAFQGPGMQPQPGQMSRSSQPSMQQQSSAQGIPVGSVRGQQGAGLPSPQTSQSMPGQGQPSQQIPNQGQSQTTVKPPPGSSQAQLNQQPKLPPAIGGSGPQPGMQQSGQFGASPGFPLQQAANQGMPTPAGMPPGLTAQSGQHSQPNLPPAGFNQPGLPPQAGLPKQSGQTGQRPPGQPSQLGPQSYPGVPPQPGMQQSGMPPLSSMSQSGLPPQSGMQQTGMPPPPGMQQPGLPPQPGMQQPGLPPQPGMQQPGLQQQPGISQPGLPPQPGMPQSQYNQYQTMPGLPHMPPPLSQQQYQTPGSQPGYGAPAQQPGGYPGMPPMPPQPAQPMAGQGYPPFPAQQPSYNQQYQQPPQKRLDPDQMPSPIQVMADDQQNRGGVFVTNEKGLVPPLVTTDFLVDDKGNASPRYIRSSTYSVPVTAELLKQTTMPFCLVLSPMAETVGTEQEPPLLDFAALTGSPTMGPVRCCRCKAYMCPNMKFIDAARHFKCAFCKATSEVPMEYTQYVNSMQQYGRMPAEMALGTYEIVATKEYCRNNTLPNPPAIVFVIDVSYNAIKNGLVQTICDNIMDIIESMPKDEQTGKSWTRVGFITYSTTVHFYNIKGTLAQPQMLSVGDVGDMFVPLLEGFLQTPEESGPVLEALLQQLPLMFQNNKETETILLPAVQAGLEALKAADTSGQLLVFHTTLPTFNAPGKLINREDRKLLGTEKEKQILTPQTTAYNELGQSCSAAGVCVQMFLCNNSYIDAATLGQLPRLTGGQLHKYTYFVADTDGARLAWDVKRVVSRPTAHDAVMRVRTSTGVRATEFYGHFFMSNTTDVELAAIDADKAIGVEIKHDDKLTAEDGVYIQAALLYTHRSGQRRLRVINLALAVAHQLADVYRSAELDTCINFLTKQAVWALREATPRQVREGLTSRCAKSLAAYRRHCASPSSVGQLVLPESMKLLPLYTSCILRSDAVAGGPDITCDDRSCAMYRALTADVSQSLVYTYPRLLPLHGLPSAQPQPLRASVDKMNEMGVYLLENGVHMLIWVGSQAPSEWVSDVFGVASPQHVDTHVCELPELDNPTSQAVRDLVLQTRIKRRNAMRLTVMRQHDKLETVLRHFLVEDRGVDGSSSYVDYLCHIHKEIRSLL
ncbi:protein transport protein Sec24D isoform X1 [Maniola jurtina]|uniref:protein transport protein Sec24D isoform X1 n=1 Tax=Maniola jurtina TaxID=191418 RepID=UPI001E68BED4|nr:protein transport protein Sec24D isoform X1 [Maniola jurtina]XP_045779680.1 protein transport protein Sec24D isoform X1 [Maniola jurtina]